MSEPLAGRQSFERNPKRTLMESKNSFERISAAKRVLAASICIKVM
jgi:hypothetical protein